MGGGGPRTEAGKRRSLVNLTQFSGKRTHDMSGVYSLTPATPQVSELAQTIKEQLEADKAVWVQESDQTSVGLLALCLAKIRKIEQYLSKSGSFTNRHGEIKPVQSLQLQLIRQAESLANSLGLSPKSRFQFGLTVAVTEAAEATGARERVISKLDVIGERLRAAAGSVVDAELIERSDTVD
ncbi:MAG: hypothetical protein AB1500_07695 [Bacillota bacterium]